MIPRRTTLNSRALGSMGTEMPRLDKEILKEAANSAASFLWEITHAPNFFHEHFQPFISRKYAATFLVLGRLHMLVDFGLLAFFCCFFKSEREKT